MQDSFRSLPTPDHGAGTLEVREGKGTREQVACPHRRGTDRRSPPPPTTPAHRPAAPAADSHHMLGEDCVCGWGPPGPGLPGPVTPDFPCLSGRPWAGGAGGGHGAAPPHSSGPQLSRSGTRAMLRTQPPTGLPDTLLCGWVPALSLRVQVGLMGPAGWGTGPASWAIVGSRPVYRAPGRQAERPGAAALSASAQSCAEGAKAAANLYTKWF